jgi:hypothetical protein
VAFVDENGREAPAISVRRTARLELARTGVVAVAIAELDAFDVPVNLCHGVLRQNYRMVAELLSMWKCFHITLLMALREMWV